MPLWIFTRTEGFHAVTARALGAKLYSSPKVIFGLFTNMEELQQEVLKAANTCYQRYLKEDMAAGRYPPYKASGMAYIRFAREETELFKLPLYAHQKQRRSRAASR